MSTKIYTGIKFRQNTLEEVLTLLKSKREEIVTLAEQECAIEFSETLACQIDRYKAKLMTREDLKSWIEILRKTSDKDREGLITFLSCDVSVVVFPHETGIYGIYFDLGKEGLSFKDTVPTDDFHYQNQSPKPDNISEKAWEFREKIWNKLLPGPGIPSHNGFTFTMVETREILFSPTMLRQVENLQPSFEFRLERVAEKIAYDKLAKEQPDLSPGEVLTTILDNPEFIEEAKKDMRFLIPKRYTKDELMNPQKNLEEE